MNAVNGMISWCETHFEVVSAMVALLAKGNSVPGVIEQMHGRSGLYGMAEMLADEFERLHAGRNWDGEYYEEIDRFLKQRLFNKRS